MTIKNLLIVPSARLIRHPLTALKCYLRRVELPHHAEIQYAGDIPTILGVKHVFVLGRYYPHYFQTELPKYCSYPSCHGAPHPTFITLRQLRRILALVDAVLISSTAYPEAITRVTSAARARSLPIAILDIPDYDILYGAADSTQRLTLHFKPGRDFDLYFKKDLPLGCRTPTIVPFGPIPVRPASYHFHSLPKKYSVFYSGRRREDQSSPERAQLVALLQKEVAGAHIVAHDTRNTFMTLQEYWDNLAQARIAFSPSGRCWDSFRHCEVGLAPDTAMLAPTPFIETCGPPLVDGKNAILYNVVLRNGRYFVAHPSEVIEKIHYYLARPTELLQVAHAWSADVRVGHTITARSRYLIDTMQQLF